MSEQPSLRDRASAIGVEIHELRREAALSNDVPTLVPLKEADRALKRAFGRGDDLPGDSYTDLKERIATELYETDLAEERVVQRRIANLTANVRREVEAKHAAEAEAREAGFQEREATVTAREREASPSYRAAFLTAGAFLTLFADLLIRVVA